MSDYSPPPSPNAFDELEDLLYDADPAPDLADELATHALHSPLLYAQDYEPGYELTEYFSDWEYYSDDYYDDDPAILKENPIDGSVSGSKENGQTATNIRGRKRKLADVDSDSVVLKERRFLKDSLKGTVWASPIPARDNVYQKGQGETVALLKDWKERFGAATPKPDIKKSRKRPRMPDDESWANDLSLADMGLLTERGSRAEGQQKRDEEDEEEDEEDEEGDDAEEAEGHHANEINLDDIEIDEEAYELLKAAAEEAARDGTLEEPGAQQRSTLRALTHRSHTTSPIPPAANTHPANLDSSSRDSQPAKRQKKDTRTSTAPLPSPPASTATTTGKPQGRTRTASSISSTQADQTTITQRHARKRKASASPSPPGGSESGKESPAKITTAEEEEQTKDSTTVPVARNQKAFVTNNKQNAASKATASASASASTASSRAKRAANTANNVVDGKRGAVATPASGTARATRSRKR